MKSKTKAGLGLLFIVALFIFLSYIVQTNEEFLEKSIGESYWGMVVYVFVFIISIVLAPISAIPLIPFGIGLWGIFTAVFLGIIGWTLGAVLAFLIARKLGVPFVKKFIAIDEISKFENMIPKENLFFVILFLRMIIPFDGLSYAVGLFTKMRFWPYFFATLLGLIPLTFTIAYLGKIDYRIQALGFLIVIIIVLIGVLINQRREFKKV